MSKLWVLFRSYFNGGYVRNLSWQQGSDVTASGFQISRISGSETFIVLEE